MASILTKYLEGLLRLNREQIPDESDLPHTFKCECDVKWVANGLKSQPCWACGTPVKPTCFHI
jgi:hypothetical protein